MTSEEEDTGHGHPRIPLIIIIINGEPATTHFQDFFSKADNSKN